ncbi:DNA-directed RNA polymerase III subunit RPC8, partial [Lachnellula cervina]
TKIADLVQIEPKDFNKDSNMAIEDNINLKYSNKVIQKIGLCICLYDLLSASDGLIGHGTGLINVNVEFRMVVFRPFKNEVILGRISSSRPEGIHSLRSSFPSCLVPRLKPATVRTKFFNEIWVPLDKLPAGTYYDDGAGVMVWEPEGDKMYFDNHETVRFRVEEEEWNDAAPVGPKREGVEVERKSPYKLVVSMEEPGMGPCLWWDEDVEGAMEVDG